MLQLTFLLLGMLDIKIVHIAKGYQVLKTFTFEKQCKSTSFICLRFVYLIQIYNNSSLSKKFLKIAFLINL